MRLSSFKFWILIFLGLLIWIIGVRAHNVGNIDTQNVGATRTYIWNDVLGWLNFHYDHSVGTHNVVIEGDEVKGFASSSLGVISLNCETTPNGDICASYTQPFFVSNDSLGNLAGWAWNDNIGWISFCGSAATSTSWNGSTWTCPASPAYQVKFVPSGDQINSYSSGWAWNDVVGWISFTCENDHDPGTAGVQSICSAAVNGKGPSDYKLQTDSGSRSNRAVIVSNIIDTESSTATYNTIMWRGTQPAGTTVQFQIATSATSTGPWGDADYSSAFSASFNQPAKLTGDRYYQKRYIRYKVILSTDSWQTNSPRIDDIIINWSP